jgi:5-formyltetrahydrofolate cyclo-ligase
LTSDNSGNGSENRKSCLILCKGEGQSEAISQTVLHHPHVRTAKVILLYKALPDEVETQMLLDQLEEEGKTVLLPVVIGPDKLELRLYEGIGKMREGTYNIQEPVGKAFLNLAQIDTAVVPGMAFDNTGNRLGRGRGYYDRLLRQMPNCYKIGICFDFQKLSSDSHRSQRCKDG